MLSTPFHDSPDKFCKRVQKCLEVHNVLIWVRIKTAFTSTVFDNTLMQVKDFDSGPIILNHDTTIFENSIRTLSQIVDVI